MNEYHFFVSVEMDDKISSRGLLFLLTSLHDKVFEALVSTGQRYNVKEVVAVTTTRLESKEERQWRLNEEE